MISGVSGQLQVLYIVFSYCVCDETDDDLNQIKSIWQTL